MLAVVPPHQSTARTTPCRVIRARQRLAALVTALLCLAPFASHAQSAFPPSDGERAWQVGQEAALKGLADSAMRSYDEALRLAGQDEDEELASAARLGQAEVWDVWRSCKDSARTAYLDAIRLSSEADFSAADAYVVWLAKQGDQAGARAVHMRTYAPIENDVPRSITRESVNFLLGLAQIQIANSSRSGALSSLNSARSVAARLAVGDTDSSAFGTVREANYWVLHDIAQLRLDPKSRTVRNVAVGRDLLAQLDAARTVSDRGGQPRFTVARLADRVARARRVCKTGACRLPPAPKGPRCR